MITTFKLFENISNIELFKNETKLKDLLMNDKSFAKSDIHQSFMNVGYNEWENHSDWRYGDMIDWVELNFGKLLKFSIEFGSYNYQVCNGGHYQYFDNGYASYEQNRRRFGSSDHNNIGRHEEMIMLFELLGIDKIPLGKEALNVMNDFELETEEEIVSCDECGGECSISCTECNGEGSLLCTECDGEGEVEDKTCRNCNGDGSIPCDECRGKGETKCDECRGEGEIRTGNDVPITRDWEKLDHKWYEIYEKFMENFNDYLKSLTLDGEKIIDLIPLASETQKYNL